MGPSKCCLMGVLRVCIHAAADWNLRHDLSCFPVSGAGLALVLANETEAG